MLQSKKRKSDNEQASSSSGVETNVKESNDPQHIKEREELETVRIDALYKIDEERKKNQQKRREIEVLEKLETSKGVAGDANMSKVNKILQSGENIVKLMVGGKLFVTSLSTINKRDNMIKTMMNSDFKVDTDENGCILLGESNPDYFPIILEHIRTGSTNYVGLWEDADDDNIEKLKALLVESDFFGTGKLSAKIAKLIKKYNKNKKEISIGDKMVDEEPQLRFSIRTALDSNQKESDEKWLQNFAQLTLNEKTKIEEFMKKTENDLEKEREELRQREATLKKESIIFNVRGVKFVISIEKLLVQNGSIFPQLILASSNNEIFLDRDSEIFAILFEFIESGTFNSVPRELSKRKLVYKEAKEFKLEGLLEFLDPLRYPVEDIGPENLKIKKDEDFLRDLFVSDRENSILSDPYLHLVNVFGNANNTRNLLEPTDPPASIPLLFDFENPVEASELINEHSRLKLPPVPKLVSTREEFFTQFNALTCGIFKDMDWSNIFCAGGGILASMLKAELKRKDLLENPYYSGFTSPPKIKQPKRKILWEEDDGSESENDEPVNTEGYFTASSESDSDSDRNYTLKAVKEAISGKEVDLDQEIFDYYQKSYWKNSDMDLFVYGLTEKEAENKIIYLFHLFKKNLKNIPEYARSTKDESCDDILLIRTENAITFKFISSVRTVQVILRIYKNPAEVLMGFDVNCCCVGFDGNQVYGLPRAIQAIKTRCNIVDVDRQSTTYELRLVKYALRGFRIGVAGMDERKIQNDTLLEDHFYKPCRYRFRKGPTAKLGNVTGLAKILLIRHSYKHSNFKGGLKSIGSGRDIESAEKNVTKSKYHDYVQIHLPRHFYMGSSKFHSAHDYFEKIKDRTEYLVEEAKKKLFFEYELNNINEIISPTKPKSDLPPVLEWITYEPTRQYSVGSFHPHRRNFFTDAYTNEKTESKSSNKKKICKYRWTITGRRFRKVLSEKEAKLVEEAYRKFKKNANDKENNRRYTLNNGSYTIDFANMQVTPENKTNHGWFRNYFMAIRESDDYMFVKFSEDTLTNIHDVLEEDKVEEEVVKKSTPKKQNPKKTKMVASPESDGSSSDNSENCPPKPKNKW